MGEHYCISLLARTEGTNLHVDVFAEWYDEFCFISEPVVERLKCSTEERRFAHEMEREMKRGEERAELIRKLDLLPHNLEFQGLHTKGAMTAYANEHFTLAKGMLGTSELREKMTSLHQRAQLERSRR